MIDKLLGAFLGAPAEQIAEYFKDKQRLKQEYKLAKLRVRIAAEKAKEERAKQADTNQHEWELLQIHNSGWKDEAVLLIISIPLVLCFIPATAEYVDRGFQTLAETPLWYQGLIITVFLAIYGIRKWNMRVPSESRSNLPVQGVTK